MDIGISNIVPIIASSTTSYVSIFSPVFLLIGGLLLAIGVIHYLVILLNPGMRNSTIEFPEFDDDLADDLEEFYSRRGKTNASYDYDSIR